MVRREKLFPNIVNKITYKEKYYEKEYNTTQI